MPSHRGSRPRGHWSEETGEFEAVGLVHRGGGRKRGLVRFWPVMALLSISVGSAWLVTDVKAGGSQSLNYANGNQPTATAPANPNTGGTGSSAGTPGRARPGRKPGAAKPSPPPAQVPAPAEPNAGGTQTEFGPLSVADKDVLTKAHLAALWQRPAALDGAKRATDPKLRDAANRVAAEHRTLDAKAVATASALNIRLPNKPNAEQAVWVKELAAKRGAEFDQLLVSRLRSAQGTMLPLVGEVRSTTENSMIRAFTQVASTSVLRAMTFIDNTGLVTGNGSENPPAANQPANPPANQPADPPADPPADNGNAGANSSDLLPGDLLPGEEPPANTGRNNGGNAKPGNANGNANGNAPQAPSGDVPSLPSAPQAQPAQPAPDLAKKSSNWLAGGDMNMWLIIGMIGIAVLISLVALRGFARR